MRAGEYRDFLDWEVRRRLGMTVEEFHSCYAAGETDSGDPDVGTLGALLAVGQVDVLPLRSVPGGSSLDCARTRSRIWRLAGRPAIGRNTSRRTNAGRPAGRVAPRVVVYATDGEQVYQTDVRSSDGSMTRRWASLGEEQVSDGLGPEVVLSRSRAICCCAQPPA